MRTHTEKLYTRNQCNKAFSCTKYLKPHMKRHILTHTGEKAYTCNQCIKAFLCTGCLRAYMSTHTGEKPYHYQCSRCDKCSSKKESWDTHRGKNVLNTRELEAISKFIVL